MRETENARPIYVLERKTGGESTKVLKTCKGVINRHTPKNPPEYKCVQLYM